MTTLYEIEREKQIKIIVNIILNVYMYNITEDAMHMYMYKYV